MIPQEVRAEATTVAGAYLQILDPDLVMSEEALDAFHVGVQAGITAALDVAQRTRAEVRHSADEREVSRG